MKINGKKLPGQWLAALVAYGLALPTAGFLGMSRALPATEPPVMEQTEATEETIPESSEVPESDMETETAQEIVEENSFSARYEARSETAFGRYPCGSGSGRYGPGCQASG